MLKKKLGDLLVENNIISDVQLQNVLKEQKVLGKKLGEIIVSLGFCNEDEIFSLLSKQLNIKKVELKNIELDSKAVLTVTESLAKRHVLIPIRIIDNNSIMVAMSDPLNVFALDDVEMTTKKKPIPVLATSEEILNAINSYYGAKKVANLAIEFQKEIEEKVKKSSIIHEEDFVEADVANSTIVKLVENIINQAIVKGASDIHIEPFENYVKVRLRIDGQLQEILRTDIKSLNLIVTRIKILGKMNIAEKRAPQDGRIDVSFQDTTIDLRVNVLPTVYGEKVVMRLIFRTGSVITKDKIGFFLDDLKKFDELLKNTNGVILVTGPTGSGKSTTFSAAIKELNKENINIITVEDPVENLIEGVNQVQVNVKAGVDFPSVLRSILRQDPDIIMIGEMRDTETARIGIRAAITGHLVLSTLHTNDSISSINRLIDMGIEPYLVSSALRGIVAQRLVRKVCSDCCVTKQISNVEAKALNIPQMTIVKKAVGCKNCDYTGYKGRFAIHEILMISRRIRKAIANSADEHEIKKIAFEEGFVTLWENAIKNVINGKTTIEEIYRAAYILD